MSDWKLFEKDAPPHGGIARLPPPPPWRDFENRRRRALTYRTSPAEVEMVNAALYLRRPLLVTGNPGVGKSSLAYAVAHQLQLGPVLVWPINSRSTLQEGLYQYDAVGRLRDVSLGKLYAKKDKSIARYLRLGPLGTALYPSAAPRVLLIDEIDKSDVDLPNDLLHVFEEGWFEIPELVRIRKADKPLAVRLRAWETGPGEAPGDGGLEVTDGRVECRAFPLVVLTSNKERDLPPAFLRRCLQLEIKPPERPQLEQIVRAHFTDRWTQEIDPAVEAQIEGLVRAFDAERAGGRVLATDQLLNYVYMVSGLPAPSAEERERLRAELWRQLGESG